MTTGSRLFIWSAFLISVFISSPIHGQTSGAGKIVGDVRVSRGEFPDHPVLISLETRGAQVTSAYTDSQGRFGFVDLIGNPYKITVNDDSYEPFTLSVDVNPATAPMNFVQVHLVPRANTRKDPLPGRVAGSNPALVDSADYNKRFPKKAVKEYEKGLEAERRDEKDKAVLHYEEALKMAPDYYPAHNNLGALYLGKSDLKSAEQHFREAVRLDPNDAQAYFNLGNVLMLTNRYAESGTTLAAGLQRRPDSAFGYFLQGCLYGRTGKLTEAESSLQHSVRLDPKMPQAYLQLVNLYLQQSRRGDAMAQLQAFLKDFPTAASAPKAQQILNRLQKEESAVKR
jgi:Tfp pilus assembly protein PilF